MYKLSVTSLLSLTKNLFISSRIPQMLTCLIRNEGRLILNLFHKVGSVYPQAVYFPIRTLYLTLKIEQRERCTFTFILYLWLCYKIITSVLLFFCFFYLS